MKETLNQTGDTYKPAKTLDLDKFNEAISELKTFADLFINVNGNNETVLAPGTLVYVGCHIADACAVLDEAIKSLEGGED